MEDFYFEGWIVVEVFENGRSIKEHSTSQGSAMPKTLIV